MSYAGAEGTTIIQVTVPTFGVGVGIYDETTDEYVTGTIIVDGVRYPDESSIALSLEQGTHVFDIELPSGFDWVKWQVMRYRTEEILSESTGRPLSWNVVEDIWIWAVLRPTIINASLTINAPEHVLQGQPFTVQGILIRTDTGAGLPGETVTLYYNSTSFGTAVTDSNGNYSAEGTIPKIGSFTLTAKFLATEIFQGQLASMQVGVGVLLSIRQRLRNFLRGVIGKAQGRRSYRRGVFTRLRRR